jgi:hypothetical protein
MFGLLFEGLKQYIFSRYNDGARVWNEILEKMDIADSKIITEMAAQQLNPSIALTSERISFDEQTSTGAVAVEADNPLGKHENIPSVVISNRSHDISGSNRFSNKEGERDSGASSHAHSHGCPRSWKSNRDYPDADFFRLLRICACTVGVSEDELKEQLGCAFFNFLRR